MEPMMDSLEIASAIPDAGDTAFQIHCLKLSAYAAVLRAFYAQPDFLSGAKEGSLAELRNEFGIFDTEHREYLMKATSNKHIRSLSVGSNKASICNIVVMKDSLDLVPVITDARDTAFQINCLERSAYASVLRAFFAQSELLSRSQAKLLTNLRKKLRISDVELREVLVNVTSNEYIKSLRNCSLANNSGFKDPAFDARGMVPDKIVKDGQVFTTFTNYSSLVQESQISLLSMPSVRSADIVGSSHRTKNEPYLDPHAVVPAKKLKSGNGCALSYLKSSHVEQLPATVCSVQVKRSTDDPLDAKTLPCEVKSGCTLSPIQLKHKQENAGHVPLYVHQDLKASMKRKSEVPEVMGSKSLTVIMSTAGNIEHGLDIKLDLTASLLSKVEKLFREKPNPVDLETAKAILKEQEKVLLDALLKLSEVSYVEECFSTNCQPDEFNRHDECEGDDETPQESVGTNDGETPPKLVSSSDEEAPPQPGLGRGGAGKGKVEPCNSDGSGGLDAADQPTSASTSTSITLPPRSERKGKAQQRARGSEFEPAAKRARRPSVRLSGSEWFWW